MDLSETPTGEPQAADPSSAEPMADPPPRVAMIHPGRAWVLGLVGAIIAGGIAAASYEMIPTIFTPPPRMVRVMGTMMNQPLPEHILTANRKNSAISLGITGGVLAMFLGLAGGLARRSGRGMMVGAVVGLILGVGTGAAAGPVAWTVFTRTVEKDSRLVTDDMKAPLMIHAGIWAAIGAAGAVALAVGAGAWRRLPAVILGGIVGAVMGAILYDVLGALIWADGRTYQIFAEKWVPRLIAALLPPLLAAAVAISGLVSPTQRTKPAAAPGGLTP